MSESHPHISLDAAHEPYGTRYKLHRSSSDQRLSWVDDVRGLGIFLVVLGHTIRGLFAAGILPQAGVWSEIDAFIYAFHMPLFFFVAGLFLIPAREEPYLAFAQKRLIRLGYPYFLWASLQTLLQCLLARYTNHPLGFDAFLRLGVDPPMQFWFLYALLIQVLCIGLLAKLGLDRKALFAFAVLVFATTPYIPLGTFMPLNQAREYLLYTALGVFCGAHGRLHAWTSLPPRRLLLAALLGYGGVALAVHLELPTQRLPALLTALAGGAASLCLASAIASQAGHLSRLLAVWGEASMAIFVAHTLASAAMRIALSKGLQVEQAWVHLVLGTLVGIAVPWALYSWGKRNHFPYAFEWPLAPRALTTD